MTLYLILSTIAFLFLSIVWSKSGLLNFSLKTIFILLTFFGVFLTLTDFGYIVRIGL